MKAAILRGLATIIAMVGIAREGFSQTDTALEDFLQQAPKLVLPKERVIAVLGQKTADIWSEIYDAAYDRQSVKILAEKRGLKVIEVANPNKPSENTTRGKDDAAVLIIDESILETKLMYEVSVLESVLNLVRTSVPVTLSKLAQLSPTVAENYLAWLEQYSPYQIELARWQNPRYQDIVICPIGLVFVSLNAPQEHNKDLGSIYLTDFYPANQNEIKSLRQQMPLYEPNLAQEIVQKRLEEIEKRHAEIRRFYANGSRISIHWINCNAEAAYTIAYLEVQQLIAERENILRLRANSLRNQLRLVLSTMFGNRYKVSTDQWIDINDLAHAMGISPDQVVALSEQFMKTRSDELRVKVEIVPGLVVGVLDKVRGVYEYSKINLDNFGVLSTGAFDVRESEVPIMELKFSNLLKK